MNTSIAFRNLAVISFIAGTILVIAGAMVKIIYHSNIVLTTGLLLESASIILLVLFFLKKQKS